ncbi:MAG: hypothetical protein HY820_06705 [Acidobacteria bacterium]|nr:hypothetical protein [Acidobacteriota bacterium]
MIETPRALSSTRTGQHVRTLLAGFLCISLALPVPGWTQGATQSRSPGGLTVIVIQGQNALNNLKANIAVQPVVEVRDENDRPVPGAEVEFELPMPGPSAIFLPGTRTQSTKTDMQGRARARDMAPNDQPGRFAIKVTATHGNRTGTVTIFQTNTSNGKSQSSVRTSNKLYWILGVAAIGGIAGGVAATRNGSTAATAATSNPVTIGAGPITVGGPR